MATPFNSTSNLLPESSVCYTLDSPWSNSIFNHNNPLHSTLPLLLLQMTLIVSLTGLLRFILRPLSQPAIVSEILGGIILGPSVLGRYPLLKAKLFPPHAWTITRTLGIVGVLFHVFNEALKQDLHHVLKSGRKEVVIALSGCFFAHISVFSLSKFFIYKRYLPHDFNQMHLLDSLAAVLALTTFPVLRPILSEFNLSTSELGRLSMTLAVINTLLGTTLTMVYSSIRHANMGAWQMGLYHFASHVALVLLLFTLVRPLMLWFIKKTSEGRRMPSSFINLSMLAVMMAGLLSDMLGSVVKAPIWLAFMIPPGPPLASALMEKTELICRALLVPFFFATNGQRFDLWGIRDWRTFCALQLMVFAGCMGKFLGTLLSALYYRMPCRDSLALAVAMCVKGIMELITFTDWLHFKLLDATRLASLELSILVVTAVLTPCLRILGRRRPRRWNSDTWRSIAQSNPEADFRLLVCVFDQDDVPSILHLVNAYHATRKRRAQLFLLHLVDLIGRGIPVLIPHGKSQLLHSSKPEKLNPIFSAFQILERHSSGCFVVHPFTSVSLYKAMHEDVYKVASENKVSLIIVPFPKVMIYSHSDASDGRQGRIVARKVLEEAPCSVGVLVDCRSTLTNCSNMNSGGRFSFHIGLVFLGGPDDREALAYASLMVDKPGVSVTVLRCILASHTEDFEMERVLDDQLVGVFRLNALNRDGIVYREAFVKSVEELVTSIRAMGSDFDLMMTGRHHNGHSQVEVALSTWSETDELGVIGDYLSSSDFARNSVSVLVVQQRRTSPSLVLDGNNASSRRKQ